jgi:hypothetical protein
MAGELLASRYVQLEMRGQAAVAKGLKAIRDELKRAKEAGVMLGKALKDGSYARAAADMAALNRQYAAMRQSARLSDLIAEHGRFGGTLRNLQERMTGLTRTAAWGFGLVTGVTLGWVRAGMAGTVEQYRLEYGFQRLSRAIAGTFKPTIDSVTNGVHQLANWFQGLSGEQQDNLRKTVLWTAGILGGVTALNLLMKMAIATEAALVSLGIVQARQAAAGAAGNGLSLMGLMGGWKGALKLGAIGLGAYALNEMTAGSGNEAKDRGIVNKLGRTSKRGLDSLWDESLGRLWTTGGERDAARRRRRLEERDQWGMLNGSEKSELAGLRGKSRTDPSLNQTGFEDIGGAYDRVANKVLEVSEPMTSLKDAVVALDETLRVLQDGGVIGQIRLPAWLGGTGG